MAEESADDIVKRLEQEISAEGQRQRRVTAAANEPADAIIARLQRDLRGAENSATVNPWYKELPAQFNQSLASAIGLLGSPAIAPFLDQPADTGTPLSTYERLDERVGASRDATIGLFRRLGFIPENLGPPQSIAGHIGAELPGAMLTAGMMTAGAPAVAARLAGSASPTGAAIGDVAAQIAARPASTARAIIGSEPGMVAARETARPAIEGAFPGTEYPTAAAAARSALFFAVEMLGSVPSERLARSIIPVPRHERFMPAAAPNEPVLHDTSDPDLAGRIARVRSANFVDTMDRGIARALERAGEPGLSEAAASVRLREGLLVARDYGRRVVDRAYEAVPDDIRGRPGNYGNALEAMAETAADYPGEAHRIPLDTIRAQIRQLAKRYDPDGRVIEWRDDVPVWELNRLRSDLIQQARDAAETTVTGSQANRYYKENLDILTGLLTREISDIGAVNPRFQPLLDYANGLYRSYNDRFLRGPVGELLITTRHAPQARPGVPTPPGAAQTPPTLVAREMLNPRETADAVAGALQWVRDISPTTGLGRAIADGTARRADEAIRVMFSDEILRHYENAQNAALKPANAQDIPTVMSMQRGPVADAVTRARNWMADNAPLLTRWTDATTRLFDTTARMNRMLQARDAHTQSTVSLFMGRPATEVVEQTLRTPDSAQRFGQLFRMFRTNNDFLEGIQRALIDSVFAGRGADPNIALARMRQGAYSDALKAMFTNDPDKLDRLYKMVENAAQITTTAVSSTTSGNARILPNVLTDQLRLHERFAKSLWENVWRIAGLASGNVLARTIPLMGSAGSLSIPMRMGRAARDLAAASWIQNRREALSIIRDAVFNPELEAWLKNNSAGNYTDMLSAHNQLNRYLRRFYAATNQDIDEMIQGHGSRLYWQERRKAREEMARQRSGPFGGN